MDDVTAITPVLQRVLDEIRDKGIAYYDWLQLRAVLIAKLKLSLQDMHAGDTYKPSHDESFESRCNTIAQVLSTFDGPPFTLQRLTEVILEPRKSYKSLNKFINALEKLLSVSSTLKVVDPRATPVDKSPEPPVSPVAGEASAQLAAVLAAEPPAVQVVAGGTDLDVVAKAPWSDASPSPS
ncbi:TPA: hypothetical protein N0F65_001162 [Lagenidium giganteum]|uniref:Uncharacterized protein n=1 Tax=Lagenidium giganteum TaxID=4803 RepID=A0AAV2YVX9_9STRA|nr:TPA: hypothetical protein N0F65_001162 [Lagenidium giganteum]